jgi:lipoprotein-releasing system ATP-binding protein
MQRRVNSEMVAAEMIATGNGAWQQADTRQPILEARELRKVYGQGAAAVTVLDGVNLKIAAGEMVAIMGPSGTGKSTLLHLLAALDSPTSGAVYFDSSALELGRDEAVAEFRNRRIGFVWQRHHLMADFTAAENVAMPLLMRGCSYSQALATAESWLGEVGLAARARHRGAELSGGEQQRVAVARALVNDPAVLLADEPTGDLAEQNAFVLMDLIERLHRTHRLTSVLATHNPVLADRCDRILRLERGLLHSQAVSSQAPSSQGEKS